MVHRINTRGDRELYAMTPHTITLAVGAVCYCKEKAGLRRSPRGFQTQTRLSSLPRLNLESSLKTTWLVFRDQVSFHCSHFPRERQHSKQRRRWVGVKGNPRNGRCDPKCPSYGSRRHMSP
ncbi:uncharacterized protein TNCV_2341001 [Trichonephila clavipes]|nr:uncharacterized protein TNCV_2341001 [Trichonephila clavipes]